MVLSMTVRSFLVHKCALVDNPLVAKSAVIPLCRHFGFEELLLGVDIRSRSWMESLEDAVGDLYGVGFYRRPSALKRTS